MRFPKALALSAILTALLATAAAAGDASPVSLLWHHLTDAYTYVLSLLAAAYRQQPALVLVLGALLVVPALAIASLLVQSILRAIAWRRRLRPAVSAEEWTRDSQPMTGVPAWPAHAWLTLEGEGHAVALASEVTSIGRHEDNILNLADNSVHRFHAVIHRSDDAHFIITDLSGEEGNGVRVNGEKCARAHLADGDRIELGRARLTFAAVPH